MASAEALLKTIFNTWKAPIGDFRRLDADFSALPLRIEGNHELVRIGPALAACEADVPYLQAGLFPHFAADGLFQI